MVVCYVYPPHSVFKQTLYTALRDRAGIQKKTAAPAEAVEQLRNSAETTGLFAPAGRDLKCLIDRAFTDDEVEKLVAWCESVVQVITEHGQKATPELCLLFIHPPAPWVGSQLCGAKYPGFCADSKGV